VSPLRVALGSTYLPFIEEELGRQLSDVDLRTIDLTDGLNTLTEEQHEFMRGAEVLVPLRGRIDEAVLEATPGCRLIQQFGAGLDSVDKDAARRRNIPVCNIPSTDGGNAHSVAELALMLLLMCGRNYRGMSRSMTSGEWALPPGRSLFGATVAIVGYGGIGREVRRLLAPFGCEVVAVVRDPAKVPDADDVRLERVDHLADVVAASDFVVLCVPLTPATTGLVSGEVLDAARGRAHVVNVSRGAVIDRDALYPRLAAGELPTIGLDVMWTEPLPPDDPLLGYDAVLTPHCAGLTDYMVTATAQVFADNIRRLQTGKPPRFEV